MCQNPDRSYLEFDPPATLRPYVEAVWCGHAAPSRSDEETPTVLPDGCIDIVLKSSSSACEINVVGTMTRPHYPESDEVTHYTGIRFRPGGASPFLAAAADTLTDDHVPLGEFWSAATDLAGRAGDLSSQEARCRLLIGTLEKRLGEVPSVDPRIAAAAKLARGQRLRVEDIARELGLSRQHLSRLFRTHVGVGPKAFMRVARMQRLRETLESGRLVNWADAACDHGYSDQSHMIAEIRSLTGLTPGDWRSSLAADVPFSQSRTSISH